MNIVYFLENSIFLHSIKKMFIILLEFRKYISYIKMNYLEINNLLSKEILPEINNVISEYLEDKFSYIDNEDDLADLEDYEVDDELIDIVKKDLNQLISDVKDDYEAELSKVDEDIDLSELCNIIESSVNDYKDIMIERYNDEFEREEYLDEYYSDSEF